MPLTEEPSTWPDPPPMSTLETLLLFGGVPLLAIAVITLLVLVPSLVRGPRYQPGLSWWAEPEWFGGPEGGLRRLDEVRVETPSRVAGGGASASW